jgi:hypothetical protein
MIDRSGRILRALSVPLQTAPLLLILVFSVLMTLAIGARLFGIALGLFLLAGFFRYLFVLLDELVDGRANAPVLSIEMMNPVGEHRSLMALAFVIGLFFGTGAAVHWFGWPLAIVVGVFVLSVLIAIVAVQAVTGSLAQSLNPVRFVGLALRLGSDFVLLVSFALALCLLAGAASALGAPRVVQIALFMYAWLSEIALIGGVLYERRMDIALEDAHEPEFVELDQSAAVEQARQRNLDRIYAEWRGGAHRNAWDSVMAHLAQCADPLFELNWLYMRAKAWPDHRFASRLAQELLPRLLAQRRNGEALDLLRERLSATADFRPIAGADLIRLAQIARDAGDRRVARELLSDYQLRYPSDPGSAAARMLMQQLEK